MATTRPPPNVLLIHNGDSYHAHIEHLTEAGLSVSEAHACLWMWMTYGALPPMTWK